MWTTTPPGLAPHLLDAAEVQPYPDVQPEGLDVLHDRRRASDCGNRVIESGEEAVTGGIEFPSPIPPEVATDQLVMPPEKHAPLRVAKALGNGRRGDDVREHHRGKGPAPSGGHGRQC